jgi:autotransporter-associated beta strand protein
MTRRSLTFLSLWPLVFSAFGAPAFGYIADDRWTTTATNGFVASVTARGVPTTVTWSFAPDGTLIPGNTSGTTVGSGLLGFLDTNWGTGAGGSDLTQRPWFPIFKQSFDRISSISGVTYVYEPNDNGVAFTNSSSGRGVLGARGDVRISGKSYGAGSNTLASNFYPDYGEMMINTDQLSFFSSSTNNYRRFRNTIMHEAMHGLGISHVESSTSGILIEPFLSTAFDGPQLDDLLAIQRLYGDAKEKDGGNDTTPSATPLGLVSSTQPRAIGSAGLSTVIGGTQTDFLSIDDDSDTDFFSFTIADTYDVSLTLSPRGASYQVGPEGGTQSTFNALTLSDLSLTLFNPNGTTIIGGADSSPAGQPESIIEQLAPGTYYARVKGRQNDIQLYQLAISAAAPGPATLVWSGAFGGSWDVDATANFKNGFASDRFQNGDTVLFLSGVATTTVNIVADVAPAAVTVNTPQGYVFVGDGGIVAGSLTIESGVVELANAGNSYDGPTLVEGGTLKITGNANAMISPISIASGGTLVLDASDAASMASTIDVQTGGTLEIGSPSADANVLPDNPAGIVNNGLIRIYDSESIASVSGHGQIVVSRETSQFNDNAQFGGSLVVASGGVAEALGPFAFGNEAGAATVESGGSVALNVDVQMNKGFSLTGDGMGAGALAIGPGARAALLGEISLGGAAAVKVGDGGEATVYGEVSAPDGNRLTLDVAPGAAVHLAGNTSLGDGGLAKRGDGTADVTGGYSSTGITDVQAGRLHIVASSTLSGQFSVQQGAVLQIDGGHPFEASGILAGDGTVIGNFTFPGTIAPQQSLTALTVEGDVSLESPAVVKIDLGGSVLGEFDRLVVTGALELDGLLEVSLIDGFVPAPGDVFDLLSAGELIKQFDAAVLPALAGGMDWSLEYSDTSVMLSVTSSPILQPADFNEDGGVNGGDLDAWALGFGKIDATRADGDADGDLMVDGADFLLWQQQMSVAATPLAAINSFAAPEPASWTSLCWALATAGLVSRFRAIRPAHRAARV